MTASAIFMMAVTLGLFWGGFSYMVYRTLTTDYDDK
ncbi:hypothetical protein DFO73_101388 [Cytobacillus oceanisediminis]|jgi:hypothetical protein|uniref:Uncharacterized protein n=1 Tax=Cytobacillus oceanisediminis TaxID=665099 RepID=A0A2V3AE62_9BACI|nr:MetS family NSS transporter small subunit [Cytobacillus oceanisediminis]PWW32125.1 hypothetical protein DFO73_101388 [Cytobacillus oceanisediminis]